MSSLVLEKADESGFSLESIEFAEWMDRQDPLGKFRKHFSIPPASSALPSSEHNLDDSGTASARVVADHDDRDSVYLCGHSLGLMPRNTQAYMHEELSKWAKMGVEGHFVGKRPWASIDEYACDLSSDVVGAKVSEVAIMGTLTNNLHLLMCAFYRPTTSRFKIIVEDHLFCSDSHAVQSQIRFHGLDPAQSLIKISPRSGEETLHTEDILAAIGKAGAELALVMFSGVQFYTGQLFDMKSITEAGHRVGAIVGFDLAHAVGNAPLSLHDWDVDFACWCSYKYLNSGPGGIAGLFVHEKHAHNPDLKRLEGWWGQHLASRWVLRMSLLLEHNHFSYRILAYSLWSASRLPLKYSETLQWLGSSGSKGYLEALIDSRVSEHVSIITPRDLTQRGSQLSLKFAKPVRSVHNQLSKLGVISDVREPDVLRICPAPLYNSFADVLTFVNILHDALN